MPPQAYWYLVLLAGGFLLHPFAQAEPAHPILTIPTVSNSATLANTILSAWNETKLPIQGHQTTKVFIGMQTADIEP